MRNLISQHRQEHKIDNLHPCEGSCPFENLNKAGYVECMHCYDLFPGWGDFALNHKSKRTESQYTEKGTYPMCPCHILGTEFVSWRIALYMEKGI